MNVNLEAVAAWVAEQDDATIMKAIIAWDAVGEMLVKECGLRSLPTSPSLDAVKS